MLFFTIILYVFARQLSTQKQFEKIGNKMGTSRKFKIFQNENIMQLKFDVHL